MQLYVKCALFFALAAALLMSIVPGASAYRYVTDDNYYGGNSYYGGMPIHSYGYNYYGYSYGYSGWNYNRLYYSYHRPYAHSRIAPWHGYNNYNYLYPVYYRPMPYWGGGGYYPYW